jgi:hypothetical protein
MKKKVKRKNIFFSENVSFGIKVKEKIQITAMIEFVNRKTNESTLE